LIKAEVQIAQASVDAAVGRRSQRLKCVNVNFLLQAATKKGRLEGVATPENGNNSNCNSSKRILIFNLTRSDFILR